MERAFYRDTWAEIDLDAIFYNVQSMKKHVGSHVDVIAVVKANAYGHGDIQVAKTALEAGATRLAVAFLDEALALRKKGIPLDVPILVLGATNPQYAPLAAKENISLTVYQSQWVEEALAYAYEQPLMIHIKFDTGMGRLGVKTKEEIERMIALMSQQTGFVLEGVYTHFATADERKTDYFEFQYDAFMRMLKWLPVTPPVIHCANSAAGLRYPDRVFNAVRLGISMYGLSPSQEMKTLLPYPLKEAFSLHSRLTHVKKVKQGEKISYGATYEAKTDEWIGTVPIGYADGWLRRMQHFSVLVDGKRAPIVGRVCMDQMMIRLPYELPIGTKVTLIGEQQGDRISIDDVAAHLHTINYEVPCTISYRVPRIFLKNKSIIEVRNAVL
ncbi:alanine racemase [Anoxybacillus sp.]|uniref:alanine racemase n=1 Tax=Anoxybacillus sp. TaxID=1872573 RepID=UPI00260B194D|nr:alanine racemase [uncultured Anoxybacillus sp.]